MLIAPSPVARAARGRTACTRQPRPSGFGPASSRPPTSAARSRMPAMPLPAADRPVAPRAVVADVDEGLAVRHMDRDAATGGRAYRATFVSASWTIRNVAASTSAVSAAVSGAVEQAHVDARRADRVEQGVEVGEPGRCAGCIVARPVAHAADRRARLLQRLAGHPRDPVERRRAPRSGSAATSRRPAPAWTAIALRSLPTTSWTSRAIRIRSRAAASPASAARSSASRAA